MRTHMPKETEKKTRKPRYKSCNADGCHKPRVRRALCQEHFAKEYPGKKVALAAAPEAPAAAPAEEPPAAS